LTSQQLGERWAKCPGPVLAVQPWTKSLTYFGEAPLGDYSLGVKKGEKQLLSEAVWAFNYEYPWICLHGVLD